jgi:hypothetical protein
VILAIDDPTLLGLAAFVTAIGGMATTIVAIRKSHAEGEADCRKKLAEARAEAEKLAAELHERKMREADEA